MVATPDPVTGAVVSSASWGHEVYLDLLRLSNIAIMQAIGTASLAASVSTSYVDVTGASISWTKNGTSGDTDVLLVLLASCWTNAASTNAMLGVNINSTDYDIASMLINPASTHLPLVGARRITGVAAGAWTPKLRFKRTSGTGAITIDTGDTISMLIGEIPK